jgi:mannosyltransferase OCH1-like enzyme
MEIIPRKIHFCWFGKNPKTISINACINSWKSYFPNFEFIEWNESNSFIYFNKFSRDALRKKKYAFVSDYMRIKVLHEFGGLYLDTDMLLLKSFDNGLLDYNFFSAEEEPGKINYAFFGSIKNHRFLSQMLNYYNNIEFDEFSPPIITNNFNDIVNKSNLKSNELILSSDYFYPLPFRNKGESYKSFLTTNSIAVHLWDHSWKPTKNENILFAFKNIYYILIDFLVYRYSVSYFKRNTKIFLKLILNTILSKYRYIIRIVKVIK